MMSMKVRPNHSIQVPLRVSSRVSAIYHLVSGMQGPNSWASS